MNAEAREYMRTIRERRLLIDAILNIQDVLDSPDHGAYHSNLWSDVQKIIDQLKTEWSK